jgi:endonuclease-3
MSNFLTQLDALEGLHGPQAPRWPVDPYEFLIWWHCGCPASDATCSRGWTSLQKRVGVRPDQLLKARPAALTMALRAGGLIPELRTERLRVVASTVVREFNGNLAHAFLHMQPDSIRRVLKGFPGIADPGADRIMLFGGICALAAVPSNATQVAIRMQFGPPSSSYTNDYLAAQRLIEAEVSPDFAARQRAFLLLKIHGQSLCKRSTPKCGECPVAETCAFRKDIHKRG